MRDLQAPDDFITKTSIPQSSSEISYRQVPLIPFVTSYELIKIP